MENTCVKEKCEFWNNGHCCNYMESWWMPPETQGSKPVLVSDCAPKRTFLMIQDLSNRLVGVQKSQEELRNETVWVQVVANVLGKNSGIDLEHFVSERKRQLNILDVKEKLEIESKE